MLGNLTKSNERYETAEQVISYYICGSIADVVGAAHNGLLFNQCTCLLYTSGDKTGDEPLSETVKQYIKEMYHKPGNVFLGVVHQMCIRDRSQDEISLC